MVIKVVKIAFAGIVFLLVANVSIAADVGKSLSQPDAKILQHKPKSEKSVKNSNLKSSAKLIDINSADKKALKKLPGIGDLEADKIIAGRPYGSKSWLATRNILPQAKYFELSDLIIARQPSNDAAINASLYKKK